MDTVSESPSESDGALCITEKEGIKWKKIKNMDAHWKRGKDAEKLERCKNRECKSDWIRDELILTNSISHWVCVSSWDLPVKRMIVAIAAVCYRKNSLSCFNLGKLDTTENPKMSSFIYRRFHNMKKWSSFMYCCSNTWISSALWGTQLQKEHINGILLLLRCGITSPQKCKLT